MLADDVIARLESSVPTLDKRVRGALELSELLRQNALPNYSPAAFVVHGGFAPEGDADVGTGIYVQQLAEALSVILVLQTAGDVTGGKAQPKVHALVLEVLGALCGFDPGGDANTDEDAPTGLYEIGVLELRQGQTVRLDAGTVFYQLDFALTQQLRIVS